MLQSPIRLLAYLRDLCVLPLANVIGEAQDVLKSGILNCLDLILEKGFSGGRWLICLDNRLQVGMYGRVITRFDNLTPADVYFGRGQTILLEKDQTQNIRNHRLLHHRFKALLQIEADEASNGNVPAFRGGSEPQ